MNPNAAPFHPSSQAEQQHPIESQHGAHSTTQGQGGIPPSFPPRLPRQEVYQSQYPSSWVPGTGFYDSRSNPQFHVEYPSQHLAATHQVILDQRQNEYEQLLAHQVNVQNPYADNHSSYFTGQGPHVTSWSRQQGVNDSLPSTHAPQTTAQQPNPYPDDSTANFHRLLEAPGYATQGRLNPIPPSDAPTSQPFSRSESLNSYKGPPPKPLSTSSPRVVQTPPTRASQPRLAVTPRQLPAVTVAASPQVRRRTPPFMGPEPIPRPSHQPLSGQPSPALTVHPEIASDFAPSTQASTPTQGQRQVIAPRKRPRGQQAIRTFGPEHQAQSMSMESSGQSSSKHQAAFQGFRPDNQQYGSMSAAPHQVHAHPQRSVQGVPPSAEHGGFQNLNRPVTGYGEQGYGDQSFGPPTSQQQTTGTRNPAQPNSRRRRAAKGIRSNAQQQAPVTGTRTQPTPDPRRAAQQYMRSSQQGASQQRNNPSTALEHQQRLEDVYPNVSFTDDLQSGPPHQHSTHQTTLGWQQHPSVGGVHGQFTHPSSSNLQGSVPPNWPSIQPGVSADFQPPPTQPFPYRLQYPAPQQELQARLAAAAAGQGRRNAIPAAQIAFDPSFQSTGNLFPAGHPQGPFGQAASTSQPFGAIPAPPAQGLASSSTSAPTAASVAPVPWAPAPAPLTEFQMTPEQEAEMNAMFDGFGNVYDPNMTVQQMDEQYLAVLNYDMENDPQVQQALDKVEAEFQRRIAAGEFDQLEAEYQRRVAEGQGENVQGDEEGNTGSGK